MLATTRPIGVRPFPSSDAAWWSCTDCGMPSRVDRSWMVELEAARGRRFSIVLCDDCAASVSAPRFGVPEHRELRSA